MIGQRAAWYPQLNNLRAALERREEFIARDNLTKGVLRCTNAGQVADLIETTRKRYNVSQGEVYGDESGSDSGEPGDV